MRAVVAVLALAGALISSAPVQAGEAPTHLAQMPRDVTDAVRKQRAEQVRRRANCQHVREGVR